MRILLVLLFMTLTACGSSSDDGNVDGPDVNTSTGGDVNESCTPNTLKCVDNTVERCTESGTMWVIDSECGAQQSCADGQCKDQICTPQAVTCTEDLSALSTCSEDGLSTEESACGANSICAEGSCQDALCEAGTTFCKDGAVHTCNAQGTDSTESSVCLDKQSCAEGQCKDQICTPQAVTCTEDLTALSTCSDDGLSAEESACGDNNTCVNGSCEAVVCKAGESLCKDGAVHICNATGTTSEESQTCDDNNSCTSDSCSEGQCANVLQVSTSCRPTFKILSPQRGATILGNSGDMSVNVTGSVVSEAGAITSFTINTTEVVVAEDGTFSHELPVEVGLNSLVMVATDALGSSNELTQSLLWSTHYLKPTDADAKSGIVTEAIGLWVDQETLDDGSRNYTAPKNLATLVELALGSFDVADSIPSPAASFALGDIYIKSLTHDAPEAELSAMSNKIRLNVNIDKIKANYEADIWGPDPKGTVTIKTIGLKADITLGVSNHKLTASVSNVSTSLKEDDINIDTSGLLGWIVDGIASFFKDTMAAELKKSFKKAAEDNIGPMLKEALNSLSLNQSFAVPTIDESDTIPLELVNDFESVTTTDQGITFVLRAAGYTSPVKTPYATATHKGVPSRVQCGAGGQALTLPSASDLEVAASDDLINSLFYAAWRGGLLEFPVTSKMQGNQDLSEFGISELALTVSGMLAPTLSNCNSEGKQLLQVGDLQVIAALKFGGMPQEIVAWASFEIQVESSVDGGCLESQDLTGCSKSKVCQTAVCALDDYCCNTQWDTGCANCAKGLDGFGGIDCSSAAPSCANTISLGLGDIESLQTQINVTDEALVSAEPIVQDLVEKNVIPQLKAQLAATPLITIPLPKIDVGGSVAGIPKGTAIQLQPNQVKHLNGNTVVQGSVQ